MVCRPTEFLYLKAQVDPAVLSNQIMVNFKILLLAGNSLCSWKYIVFLPVLFSKERANRSYFEEVAVIGPRTLNNPIEVASGFI